MISVQHHSRSRNEVVTHQDKRRGTSDSYQSCVGQSPWEGPVDPPGKAGAVLGAPATATVAPTAGAVVASTTCQAVVTVCVSTTHIIHCIRHWHLQDMSLQSRAQELLHKLLLALMVDLHNVGCNASLYKTAQS